MNSAPPAIHILLVDDHPVVRHGVSMLLQTQSDFRVVGEASTTREAIAFLQKTPVHVVLLDIRLPHEDGLGVLAFVKTMSAKPAVLVLSSHDGESVIGRAFTFGALGYVSKVAPAPEVIRAVRTVAAGKKYISDDLSGQLASFLSASPLTAREVEILQRIARGLGNAEIGKQLGVAEKTIKNQLTALFEKLGAADRTHAVMVAVERGLIELAVGPPRAP